MSADEAADRNAVILDVIGGASYTDNVFANNLDRVHDILFNAGGNFIFNENRSRYDINLDYRPSLIAYRQYSGYDQVNQDLGFQGLYRATPHFDMQVQDTTAYFRGTFEIPVAETSFSPIAAAPSLNQTVFTPLVDEFSNETRADAVDRISPNGTIDLFAAFEDRRFGNVSSSGSSENLFNTLGGSGGLTYTYRLNRTLSLAPSYIYQSLEFGSSSRGTFNSATLTLTWKATPTLTFSVFGGAQHTRVIEDFIIEIPEPGNPRVDAFTGVNDNFANLYSEYGASITKDVRHFQFQISGRHTATDGGGVLTSVIDTYEDAAVRWDISEHWEARLTGENSATLALSPAFSNGKVQSQDGGFALVRHFTPRLSAQLGYDYTRQRVAGAVPFFVNMDRNLASFSITYRLADFPLGR